MTIVDIILPKIITIYKIFDDLEANVSNRELPRLNNGVSISIKKLGKDNYNPLESFFDEENLLNILLGQTLYIQLIITITL